MPRESAASRATPKGEIKRPTPPSTMTKGEKSVWRKIVASCDPDFFHVASLPLLVQFCRVQNSIDRASEWINELEEEVEFARAFDESILTSKAFHRGTEALDRLLKMRDRDFRTLIQLATKLRLAQTSLRNDRGNPKGNSTPATTSKPWETEDEQEIP